MMRSYQVRLKATKRQALALTALLGECCELYNASLQERRDAWKVCQKHISLYDQQKELTQLRAVDDESASFPATIQRDPLSRVDLAFKAFFRRVKAGQTPGYPRFKSRDRYHSFSVGAQNFRLEGDTIIITKLGGFRFHTRCKIKGTPKALHVKRVGGKWRAVVACDIGPAPEKIAVRNAIGIDLGCRTLLTTSDRWVVENPHWTRLAEKKLARANRQLASKQWGSNNRAKARERLRRVHEGIQGRRRAWLHGVSQWLVDHYDLIAYEKLNIPPMVAGNFTALNKTIMDASWAELIFQISYKAEHAGKFSVAVDSSGTTNMCSGCGEIVPKKLKQRIHHCPKCGLLLDRDHNSAVNVLQRGLRCAGVSAEAA
jgi:putative transposase